jgi:hypothetical protein
MKIMRQLFFIPLLLLSVSAAPTTQVVKFDLEPTKITAKLNEVSAKALFEELARQAGETLVTAPRTLFDDPPLRDARFSAEFDAQPYWSAMLEFCEQAKLTMQFEMSDPMNPDALHLHPYGNSGARPSSLDGPVLFVLEQLQRSSDVRYGSDPPLRRDQLRINAKILLEPKLRQRCTSGEVKITRAVDEAGNALTPIKLPPLPWRVMAQPTFLGIVLEYPQKACKTLKEISGEVELTVPKRVLRISMLAEQGAVDADVGENVMHIRVERRGAAVGSVALQLVREEESDEGWAATIDTFMSSMRIALETSKRTVVINQRSPILNVGRSLNIAPDHAENRIPIGGLPGDEKLVRVTVEWPLETQTHLAHFKFSDLPVP